ncbi:hypothetical protein IFM89_019322 [Coptis chinensis]|uniref:Helicase C-terminal domain-containing protein n=1 Tax=Coptis chinensis TaxID=261450 RepID=A0A835M0N5_9MAGN|nr:hypothetical protein IFM89_019322 [Coptis chinensis]
MRDIRKANKSIQIFLFSANFNETVKSFAAKHETSWGRVIFVNSKNSAKILHEEFGDYGYGCTTLHGNLDKEYRDKVVKEFKDGLTKVLISTDVLARDFKLIDKIQEYFGSQIVEVSDWRSEEEVKKALKAACLL